MIIMKSIRFSILTLLLALAALLAVGPAQAASGMSITDTNIAGQPQRFYRIEVSQ